MGEVSSREQPGYIVGVDLGGTKIATALLTTEGQVVAKTRMETPVHEGPDVVIERMAQTVREVQLDREIIGVGVGSPGPLNSKTGVILYGPNLPGWENIPLKDKMEARLGTKVLVANDANAAAWGEYVFGAGRGTTNMVYVTVSTGIGAGLILNGELFEGSDSYGGELGHTIVDPNGPQCGCGAVGCWEACASGTAIGKYAAAAIQEKESLIATLAAEEEVPVSAKHVFIAAEQGDVVATEIFEKAIHYLAIGFTNIIHSYNPERIVVGGGVSNVGDFLFNALREKTAQTVMAPYRGTYEIVPASLGNDVGFIGAAALFLGKK